MRSSRASRTWPGSEPRPAARGRRAPWVPGLLRGPLWVLLWVLLWAFAEPGAAAWEDVSAPGAVLDGRLWVPEGLAPRPALVVALHGCAMEPADFDDETGWRDLADAAGFLLLLPAQSPARNPARCFNWMLPGDRVRGSGEPATIVALAREAGRRHRADPDRVFATGLSAGGAMTAVLLAAYPDVFAAGGIVAGLPYLCVSVDGVAAATVAALGCMNGGNPFVDDPREWARRVRAAAPPGTTAWPRVSIWAGLADGVVHPRNARDLAAQWTAVHGLDPRHPTRETRIGPARRVRWADRTGTVRVELWEIEGLGHAVPVDEATGCGRDRHGWLARLFGVDDHMTDVGLCAAREIARFFGLIAPARTRDDRG